MRLVERQSRVDTLVAVVIAEDASRKEGWQYSGALIYDLKAPNSSPQPRIPLIGSMIADNRAVDVMSIHEGLIINGTGMHMVLAGPGDGGMLLETCRSIIARAAKSFCLAGNQHYPNLNWLRDLCVFFEVKLRMSGCYRAEWLLIG